MGIKEPKKKFTAVCQQCKNEWNEPQERVDLLALKPLRCAACGSFDVDVEEQAPRKAASLIVRVSLDDGDFREFTFEGRVKINADWMKDFSQAREISDALCAAFLKSTEGKPREAYKEYDAEFTLDEGFSEKPPCPLCAGVNVYDFTDVCDPCREREGGGK